MKNLIAMVDEKRISRGLYWQRAWTLVQGCTHVSEGCDHCWSATATHMRAKNPNDKVKAANEGLTDSGKFTGAIRLMEKNLELPKTIKKPTLFAVWNDLFHEDVPDDFIFRAWNVMWECPQHTFIVLTKRSRRMLKWVNENASHIPMLWGQENRWRPGIYDTEFGCFARFSCGYEGEDTIDHDAESPEWPERGYKCEHQKKQETSDRYVEYPGVCTWPEECPLGYRTDGYEDIVEEAGYSEDEFTWVEEEDGDKFTEDPSGLWRLTERPRGAFVQNIILGVTCENSNYHDRIADLLYTKAEMRMVSVEPCLDWMRFGTWLEDERPKGCESHAHHGKHLHPLRGLEAWKSNVREGSGDPDDHSFHGNKLNWVVIGAETGSGARDCDKEWIKAAEERCKDAGIPIFVKSVPPLYYSDPPREFPGETEGDK